MKRLACLGVAVLAVMVLLPVRVVFAQKSLPQVPITYPGDTDKTITRRAQLVAGAKKEGTVTIWGSFKPDELKQLSSEFNKIYPFIKINYWRGQDNERITRFETDHSANRTQVDISDAGSFESYPRWRKIGLVERFIDFIPGIEKMDKRMYSKHGDWALIGNNATTPQYNTKLVSAGEAPKSWEDLLNPKWKGAIGMTTDVRAWYIIALGEGGWGVEKTENFLKKLKQQEIIWTRGHSAAIPLLEAGEFKIMGEQLLRYAWQSQEKGAPIDWCRTSPVPISGGTFFLTKKAPHPNAARLYIEWLFSPPGQLLYENITGYGAAAPGSGTRLSKALEGMTLVYRTEELALKLSELKLVDKFSSILEVTPE